MTMRAIRQLLADVDLPDPHAFATAFVSYVERNGKGSLSLTEAVDRWTANGTL